MKTKNLFDGDALDGPDYLLEGVCWNTLYQKMNMVSVKADFQKVNLVPLLYFQANFLESGGKAGFCYDSCEYVRSFSQM